MRDARDPTSPSAHSTHVTGKGASGEIFYSKGWNVGGLRQRNGRFCYRFRVSAYALMHQHNS